MDITHSRLPDRCAPPQWLRALALALVVIACALTAPASSPAVEYHTTCVGHGFVAGSSPTDGSFFSRIETGCGTTARTCKIYNWGTYIGDDTTTTTTCNAWSNSFGSYTECASYAKLYFPAAFSEHNHTPDNYCATLAAVAMSSRIQRIDPVPDAATADSPAFQPDDSGSVIAVTNSDGLARSTSTMAVRLYRSKTGLLCPDAGRVQEGEFGGVDQNGDFRRLELTSSGSCFDQGTTPVGFVVRHRATTAGTPASTTLFGAAPEATSVSVTIGGETRELALGTAGAFVEAVDPDQLAGATLTATMNDGRTLIYDVPVSDS